MKLTKILVITILSLILIFIYCGKKKDNQHMLKEMFEGKKEVTILVTDSGLGGLSVAADVAKRLPESGVFEKADIIFYNALFHNKSGYNSLDSEKEKVEIFNRVLNAMDKRYDPDLLLIACNTLSVLYHKTPFSKKVTFPVIGIVETGVDLIQQQFEETPDSKVIIFATKTTIAANSHKNMLVDRGIAAEKIIGQPCHKLAGSIERGTDSEETIGYIEKYVQQALENVNPDEQLFASLNCTHYGYSIDQFRKVFADAGYEDITIIDPNPRMADFLFAEQNVGRYPETETEVKVVSKVEVSEKKIDSLDSLIYSISPEAALALKNYKFMPDLFDAKFEYKPKGEK